MPMGQTLTTYIATLLFLLAIGSPCLPQSPDDPISTDAVRITSGPVVEQVTATTATIAWSTNVNAGTTLRYGTEPDQLDLTANMPWGGYTHRVYLKGLKPGTTYFFQAESGEGQGTGSKATAAVDRFQTRSPAPKPPAGESAPTPDQP
ncbi:MAG TPA: fibronectin type III domain-containing protein [Terriglobales bacterium]|nr:fibronectin type III domain-containing protein [Terriglobales bacterium]